MNKLVLLIVILVSHAHFFLIQAHAKSEGVESTSQRIALKSRWLQQRDGTLVVDPQTSGLIFYNDFLISIGDGSAAKDKQLKLMPIDRKTQTLQDKLIPIVQSKSVRQSCFSDYLSDGPDLEALAQDPLDPSVIIIATEDFYEFRLTGKCLEHYGKTGSTAFPSLLLRVEIGDNQAVITHVRAIQFPSRYRVGNFPNDGVEGLTFGAQRTLYIGVEKDLANRPRIFQTQISPDFWEQTAMVIVEDSKLAFPPFRDSNNHPINGLAYIATDDSSGFVIAAARNDNELWLLDTAQIKPPQVLYLDFLAESRHEQCPNWQTMDNYSIEGIVVIDKTLWLINDPWKVAYKRNAICPEMTDIYAKMTPLLSSLAISSAWLAR